MFIYLAIAYTNLSKDMRSIMEQELNKSIVIAYYLSRRDKEGLNVLGYNTFSKAFKEIGEIIGENPNNLKNMRDDFDPLFPNERKGWHQRDLSASRQEVFDKFSKMSDLDLDEYVKGLLNGNTTNNDIYIQHNLGFDTENAESLEEYRKAAEVVKNHISTNRVNFRYSNEEVEAVRNEFLDKFAPEKLAAIPDEKLLKSLFYSKDGNGSSLSYVLENQEKIKNMFGGIAGGSTYKFGLFQRNEDDMWVTGSGNKPTVLTENEALELGKGIRDEIIEGATLIAKAKLNTKEDYESLDTLLNRKIKDTAKKVWVQKYYQILYPEKFVSFYTEEWLNHYLYALDIEPSEKFYGKKGQLAIVKRLSGLEDNEFSDSLFDCFKQPKKFIRLGSSIDNGRSIAGEWRENGIVAIGWPKIGSLKHFAKGNSLNREKLVHMLKEEYYSEDSSTSSRKAGEIIKFFNTNKDTVFTIMNGEELIALVDELGEYYFDSNNAPWVHCKKGAWHMSFLEDEFLPKKSEGKLTTCYEFKEPENLQFLYRKYYYDLDGKGMTKIGNELKYNTGLKTIFPANRIIFGAPGTGKSYTLEQERKKTLQNETIGGYERVTFHPDYTYSQFVGTYKPVTDRSGTISYQFVPGPFMRVYVEALKNGRSGNPEPYILIIEEINRANVAAVFGDVFQLLDRDSFNVSEYPIHATEDVRTYLAVQLGGNPEDYTKIKIPDNMLIWATMNSADQGVFPMDTAFKRRWDFNYLGINNGEGEISGKFVILGEGEHRKKVEWNILRKEINNVLLNDCKVNEDKLMGPFFLEIKNLSESEKLDKDNFSRIFKNKVIMYLFDDAAKQKRPTLFSGCDIKNIYSAICDAFDEKGVDIFNESIRNAFLNSVDGVEE